VGRPTVTELGELEAREVEAWRELAGAAAEPNPFYEPDFALPAAEALKAPNVALVAVWDADGMLACLPVSRGRWRGTVPAMAGWRHAYSFLGTPLVRAGADAAASDALLELVGPGRDRFLVLERACADGPVMTALASALEPAGLRCAVRIDRERALLCPRDDGEYLSGLSTKHRRDLARLGRRLGDALGGELRTVDRAGDDGAVDEFLALEGRSWKGAEGTAMVSSPGHAELFTEICRRFDAAGRLELLELGTGERVAAMKCNLRAGEGSFAFKIAHDEELSRFSPGVQLELENIERFDASDAAWMDSCAEWDNAMINRLWPERRRLCTVVVTDRSVIGRLGGGLLRLGNRVRDRRRS
jgi:CelD/BcsL family acetyltransferase involved in cellulose biosynthesis